ncbi:carbohydrate-binding protein [Actinophytocola algeriensis]|uniref:CBM6 domain-containing protein n=1 Tax=Actinophytocola algeriensis TaxID=1768010 RepID=A0A7W7Q1Z7_9PSEU|nr:carbohydrate-binding protein [Actinophytocola algeriensis]MBB4905467.1 hypothetical protein [Actinophytocola algeriensis]MBE1472848.1 hypothetical protein [Actinophytocola algeriensis]
MFRTLSVVALAVALLGVVPPGASAAPLTLEAESASLTGGAVAESEHAGYSGAGYVGGFTDTNKGRAAVTFTVTAPGAQTLALRYANGTGSTMTLSLYVGTQRVQQVALPSTGSWTSWGTASTTVALPTGSTGVAYRFDSADSGNVNLDRLTVTGGTPAEPGTFEAETAALAGGAVAESEHAGYSGTGYVGGLTDTNKGRAAVTFTVTAPGAQTLTLRYANGTGSTMTLSLYVGAQRLQQVALPATGGWATWGTATSTVTLPSGASGVGYRFDTTDSGNVNLDRLTVTGSTPVTCDSGTCFEAETGHLAGGTTRATGTTGFSGTGYATGFTSDTARLVIPVGVAASTGQTLTIRYTATQNQAFVVTGNGLRLGQVTLTASSGWANATLPVTLPAGLGSIGLSRAPGRGGTASVDRIALSGGKALAARGATVPYTEYEAENAATNGSVFGPDRTFRTVPAEASGRRGVRLQNTGSYVEFTLTQPANSLVVRASIPDSADGGGTTAPIGVYVGGTKVRDLTLSSVYSWVYGAYPYTNNPGEGGAQRFFGEARTRLDALPAGTKLRLQKDSPAAAYIDVDLIDTENVGAALAMPAGYVNVTQHGATPDDDTDDTAAIRAAVAAARSAGTGVWVPAGRFVMADRVDVHGVAVRGAGPWYSVLKGRSGKGGFFATGSDVTIADLMIDGDVRYRDDANFHAALEGDFGTGSLIQNVWIEHTKVGLWADNGTDGLLALGLRIRNTFADGVNFHGNVRDTSVRQSAVRNTGDDALAMWSDGSPVTRGAFTFNTVQIPMLGNGIGIYGGTANRAEDNVISDTLTASAGIAVGTRFNPVPLSGETLVQRNTLVRTGGLEPNWNSQLGALWLFADTADITAPVTVRDVEIRDSTYAGILMTWQRRIENATFERVTVTGTGTYGIEVNATGNATFSYTAVSGAPSGGLSVSPGFTVNRGPGNSGF